MRVRYLDSLKLVLTTLVIAHHVAISYGASGSWFYIERDTATPAFRDLGTLFTTTNQFFFMGLFFFISGYFTPGALARKGTARFLRDRFVRLGIPLVLFSIFVAPYLEHHASGRSYRELFVRAFERCDFILGPLWFALVLLVFSIAYAMVRPRATSEKRSVRDRHLLAVVVMMATASFVVRIWFPIGYEWRHLQLAFFPQYILLFALGTRAEPWLDSLGRRHLRTWMPALAAVIIALIALIALVPHDAAHLAHLLGGAHLEAIALPVLEAIYCVAASVTLLVVFRARFTGNSRLSRAFAPDAYAAYVIHAPVIVALGAALAGLALGPWLKFAIVTALGAVASFAASHWILRRSALVRRVL